MELTRDNRFKESHKRKYYSEFDANLSVDETRELYEKYKGNASISQKWRCLKFKRISSPCGQLQDALFHRASNYSHFHVNICELESGL